MSLIIFVKFTEPFVVQLYPSWDGKNPNVQSIYRVRKVRTFTEAQQWFLLLLFFFFFFLFFSLLLPQYLHCFLLQIHSKLTPWTMHHSSYSNFWMVMVITEFIVSHVKLESSFLLFSLYCSDFMQSKINS